MNDLVKAWESMGYRVKSEQTVAINPELTNESLVNYWSTFPSANSICIPWAVDELCLASPAELEDYQYGYRWSGFNFELDSRWKPEWVVIGIVNGDPVIVDVSKKGGPVHLAIHGIGHWDPMLVSDSVEVFVKALSEWVILYRRYDGKHRAPSDELDSDFEKILVDQFKSAGLNWQQIDNLVFFIK